MTTPTDPYNSASRRPFDDDDVLAPLEQDDVQAAEKSGLSYGDSDLVAWDQAFSAHSAAVADDASDDETEGKHVESTGDSAGEAGSELHLLATERTDTAQPADSSNAADPLFTSSEDSSRVAEGRSEGYNALPDEERKNATLVDVVSAHSADDADDTARPSRNRALAQDETFTSGLGVDDAEANISSVGTGFAAGGMAVTAAAGALNTDAAHASADTAVNAEYAENREGFVQAAGPDHDGDRQARWSADPGDDAYLEVPDEPQSRTGAHIGIFFATLLLLPLAWYLLSDAGVRLGMVKNNPWDTGSLNFLALGELVAGVVVMLVIFLVARASSLGAQVLGALVAIAGTIAILLPTRGARFAARVDEAIGSYNAFTANVAHHLNLDLATGRVAILGFVLLFLGVVAHGARRRGAVRAAAIARRELLLKDQNQ
ncbi:hypothetical protein [Arcanobacterium bovis]|uniref:Uncharacterized protein n=1 Tax=Arcanobacterium bovis TaxID=2529275 RepID=A0A4Q9V417_9ACTO|nr:hypothetical protein [Arcanobacterium bovis]TBW23893.1 hypothetical protein EZJ44_01855 [Arcanobacterium bovis]